MKCDRCKIRQAVASVTKFDEDGKPYTEKLGNCDECCAELKFLDVNSSSTSISSGSMSELQEYLSDLIMKEASKSGSKSKVIVTADMLDFDDSECINCGLKLSKYKKTMMLGCQYCYDSFEKDLEPQLMKYHRVSQHISAATHSASEAFQVLSDIQDMQKDLEIAVEAEDFQHAAKLRDQIDAAQKKLEELNKKAREESGG